MNASKLMLPAVVMFALVGAPFMATDAMSRPVPPCMSGEDCSADEAMGPHGPRMGRAIYSPEQQKKYDAIIAEFTPRMEPLREALFVKKHQLRALEHAAHPDIKAVEALAKEQYQVSEDMRKLRKEMRARIAKEVGKPELIAPCNRRDGSGRGAGAMLTNQKQLGSGAGHY